MLSDSDRQLRLERSAKLSRMAIGCYVAVILLAALALIWPRSAWFAIGAAIVGFWCQRAAAEARPPGD